MKIYNASDHKGNKLISEESLKLRNLCSVDQQFNKDSTFPQSGTAVAEAISSKAEEIDLLHHKENTIAHVTLSDREKWDTKVGEIELEEVKEQFHQEIKDKITGALHYKGVVDTFTSLPEGTAAFIGDFYNIQDTGFNYAWNGIEWEKLSDDLTGLTNNLTNLNDRVTDLETNIAKITVDQNYDGGSNNPQSGTAVAEAVQNFASLSDVESHTNNNAIHIIEDNEHIICKVQSNLTNTITGDYKSCAFTPMYSGELKSIKFICRETGITDVEVWCQLYKATKISTTGAGVDIKYIATSINSQMLSNKAEITFYFNDAKHIIDGDLYLLQFVSENEKDLRDLTSSTNLQLAYFSTLETLEGQQLELTPKFYSIAKDYSAGIKVPCFPSYELTFISPVAFTADGKTRLANHDEFYKNELALTQKKLVQHIDDNFRHTTADQLEEAVTTEYIVSYTSIIGTVDKTFNYCNINKHVPTGKLKSIIMKAPQTDVPVENYNLACYLSVYELSSDGENYNFLGTSDNSVKQVAGEDYVWNFTNVNINLTGKEVKLCLTSTPVYPVVSSLKFSAHCGNTSKLGPTITLDDSVENYMPEILWNIGIRQEKFAPIKHTLNEDIHVSLDEKAKWNQIEELATEVDTISQTYQSKEDIIKLISSTEIVKENTSQISYTSQYDTESCKCVLNKKYIISPGRLTHFKVLGATTIAKDLAPDSYLHLFTSIDGRTWKYLCHSDNATHTTRNTYADWTFSKDVHLDRDHHIMMIFSSSSENIESNFWLQSDNEGISGVERTDDDTISCIYDSVTTSINYLPIVEIVTAEHTALDEHCFDKDLHTSKKEKEDIISRLAVLEAKIAILESSLNFR